MTGRIEANEDEQFLAVPKPRPTGPVGGKQGPGSFDGELFQEEPERIPIQKQDLVPGRV